MVILEDKKTGEILDLTDTEWEEIVADPQELAFKTSTYTIYGPTAEQVDAMSPSGIDTAKRVVGDIASGVTMGAVGKTEDPSFADKGAEMLGAGVRDTVLEQLLGKVPVVGKALKAGVGPVMSGVEGAVQAPEGSGVEGFGTGIVTGLVGQAVAGKAIKKAGELGQEAGGFASKLLRKPKADQAAKDVLSIGGDLVAQNQAGLKSLKLLQDADDAVAAARKKLMQAKPSAKPRAQVELDKAIQNLEGARSAQSAQADATAFTGRLSDKLSDKAAKVDAGLKKQDLTAGGQMAEGVVAGAAREGGRVAQDLSFEAIAADPRLKGIPLRDVTFKQFIAAASRFKDKLLEDDPKADKISQLIKNMIDTQRGIDFADEPPTDDPEWAAERAAWEESKINRGQR